MDGKFKMKHADSFVRKSIIQYLYCHKNEVVKVHQIHRGENISESEAVMSKCPGQKMTEYQYFIRGIGLYSYCEFGYVDSNQLYLQ